MEQMTMPMWVNVFIGIAAALGGWEAIKYVLSLRANRRKDKAEVEAGTLTVSGWTSSGNPQLYLAVVGDYGTVYKKVSYPSVP